MSQNELQRVVAEMREHWDRYGSVKRANTNDWASRIESAQAVAPGGESEHVRKLVGKLDQWRMCMSYNESYFGEPAGLVKATVADLAKAVDPIYPPKVEPADPLAGVTIHTVTVPLDTGADALLKALAEALLRRAARVEVDDELASLRSAILRLDGVTRRDCLDAFNKLAAALEPQK